MKNVSESRRRGRSRDCTAPRASASRAEGREPFTVRVERFRGVVAQLIVQRILAARRGPGRAGGPRELVEEDRGPSGGRRT